jgi:VIT1/CCC1 family predicted Fe2+/Mn2+ transporter
VSAASFASLAILQIFVVFFAPAGMRIPAVGISALVSLAGLGALGAQLAGAPLLPAALRVLLGGGLAMSASALVGKVLGGVRF